MTYWIVLATFVIGLIALYCSFKKNRYERHGIPYKKPIPIFGNMAAPLFRRISFAEHLQKYYYLDEAAKYVGFCNFGTQIIMIRDPELVKDITIKHFDHFVDHLDFVDPVLDPLFGNNLFSLRGDKWREIRNLLSPSFTSSKMRGMFKLMSTCGENFAGYLAQRAQSQPYTVNSKEIFTRYANDVIATCAFGISIDSMRDPNNEFYVLGKRFLSFDSALSIKFFVLRSFSTLARLLRIKLIEKKVETFFYDVIRETITTRDEKGIIRPDMIQLMMETRKNQDAHGPELTIEDMTSQAFVFFLGGFDTSSLLMCFVAHEIAVNSEVQKNLQNEVDEVLENCNGDPTYEAINGMPYLDAVLNESMRLYPIAAMLDRVCTKTYTLPPTLPGAKPLTLKVGDNVWIPVYPFHRDPQYYPDPDKFLPERFLTGSKSILNSSCYIPFGIGPRMCIGNRFALLETKVLIFHLIAKCELKPSKKMILPLELNTTNLSMSAKGGFWIDLCPRDK